MPRVWNEVTFFGVKTMITHMATAEEEICKKKTRLQKQLLSIGRACKSVFYRDQQGTVQPRNFSHGWVSAKGFTTHITNAVSATVKLNLT